MDYRSEAFDIRGHTVEIKVPVLYVDEQFVTDSGIVRYSQLWQFLFVQGEPPLSQKVGAAGIGVYAAVLQHADKSTGLCNPSHARLAAMLSLTEKTVRKHLDVLQHYGLIVRLPRLAGRGGAGGRHQSDWYYLNRPMLRPKPQRVTVQRNPVKNTGYQENSVEITEYSENPVKKDAILGKKGGQYSVKTTEELDREQEEELELENSSGALSEAHCDIAFTLVHDLIRCGVKLATAKAMVAECPPDSIRAAMANADQLDAEGILANKAGYLVRACFGANREETVCTPTKLTQQRRQQRLDEAAAAAETAATWRAQQRPRRQAEALKQFGDMDRWQEIPLIDGGV